MPISEMARIKQEIEAMHLAAQLGLSGLASGTAKHQFIQARMSKFHEELHQVVGEQQAIIVLGETLDGLSDTLTRYDVLNVLRRELGTQEATAHLIDWILDIWSSIDVLKERFGALATQKILVAPASSLPEGGSDAKP